MKTLFAPHAFHLRSLGFLSALVLACTPFSGAYALSIMPMGDSITVGVDYTTPGGSPGGYRTTLASDLTAHGVPFSFVGVNTSNPSPSLTSSGQTAHNGYGGYHVTDLDANINGVAGPVSGGDSNLGGYWLTGGHGTGRGAVTPNIILVEAGTNDLLQQNSVATTSANLLQFVTDVHNITPTSLIIIGSITPINDAGFQVKINQYNSYIQNTLVPSLSYARFADVYSAFKNPDGSINFGLLGADKIHPVTAGYELIGNVWDAAVEPTVPEPGPVSLLSFAAILLTGSKIFRSRRKSSPRSAANLAA